MGIQVKGIYDKGIVRLTEPLPDEVDRSTPQEEEVSFEPISEDEAAVLAELDRIEAEIQALGDPKDDAPEERTRHVELLMEGLQIGPPTSEEVEAELLKSIERPMSMFRLDEEQPQ